MFTLGDSLARDLLSVKDNFPAAPFESDLA
jgi:hypothetical protein